MTRSLVIVESPAKASTIQKYLGKGYVVESSIGHIRDLARPADLDKEVKTRNEYIKEYAVDVQNDFEPFYLVSADRKSHIAKLRKELKNADVLLLATDEDREGESIAWHLVEVLNPKVPVRRMVFHEITPKAIQSAVDAPRDIDQSLVDAQEARRILDRLYGFAMSKVVRQRGRGRSAGRVQSVATRAVVERERERVAFVKAGYWDIEGMFATASGADLTAILAEVDGKRVASGRDFDDRGQLKSAGKVVQLREADARALAQSLEGRPFSVDALDEKDYRRRPAAPFMTSTLQQEAGRKLRFGSQRTMRAAQRLYENGYITYMRTDSTTLSTTALAAARKSILDLYDAADLPKEPRVYARKVKNAQEAHEAIRPAGDEWRTPDSVRGEVGPDEAKIYELIWKRTVASQMEDARGKTLTVRIGATAADGRKVQLSVRGNAIIFPGFLKAYVEGSDDPAAELESRETHLPPLQLGEALEAKHFEPKGHETQPPARFTEASLVKWLEERGIGRPSTYAQIIGVIQERGYVWKKGTALVPTFKAFQVTRLLEGHFHHLVDYDFTARMEDDLDAIASGQANRNQYLERFFFGQGDHEGLDDLVKRKLGGEIDLEEIRRLETIDLGEEKGERVVVKMGQYGPYLQHGERTASVPDDMPPDELDLAKALELLDKPSDDRDLGKDPETGLSVLLRTGRYGTYVQLGEVEKGSKEKPKTASILSSMDPATLTLADGLKMLALPREVGTAPDGEVIQATNGRYGPYLTKGKDNRSLETEDQIFTVTVAEALALFAQPKRGRRQKAAPPLRELGNDPVSEKLIVLKEGRWGPYVTDGETNASLRKSDDPKTITPERAQELLLLRREKAPTTKGRRRATKKKTRKAAKKSGKTTKSAASKTKKKTATKKKKAAKKSSTKDPKKRSAAAKKKPSTSSKSSKSTKATKSAEGPGSRPNADKGPPSGAASADA